MNDVLRPTRPGGGGMQGGGGIQAPHLLVRLAEEMWRAGREAGSLQA